MVWRPCASAAWGPLSGWVGGGDPPLSADSVTAGLLRAQTPRDSHYPAPIPGLCPDLAGSGHPSSRCPSTPATTPCPQARSRNREKRRWGYPLRCLAPSRVRNRIQSGRAEGRITVGARRVTIIPASPGEVITRRAMRGPEPGDRRGRAWSGARTDHRGARSSRRPRPPLTCRSRGFRPCSDRTRKGRAPPTRGARPTVLPSRRGAAGAACQQRPSAATLVRCPLRGGVGLSPDRRRPPTARRSADGPACRRSSTTPSARPHRCR